MSVVKIRGKGHELEDLTNICKAYEHWAHRLYPKMRCEDVLEKVEVLGMKNQTKCRMHKAVLYQKHRRLNDIMGKNSDDDDDAAWPEVRDYSSLFTTFCNLNLQILHLLSRLED